MTKETQEWGCMVCDWIYDPKLGSPKEGIAAGTPFEDIPEDWACPLCGARKAAFEKIER